MKYLASAIATMFALLVAAGVSPNPAFAALVFIAFMLLAIIPAKIAENKGHDFVLWWSYGVALFIVAFVHSLLLKPNEARVEAQSLAEGSSKKCPFCAELVKQEAIKCRHCGSNI